MSDEFGGWDPDDMAGFWDKVYAIEGAGNTSDEALDEALQRFGLSSKRQFDEVREAFHQHYADDLDFPQAGIDSRTRSVKQAFAGRIAQGMNGELAPVEGATLEQWAFVMAKVASSQDITALLAKAGWDRPQWDRISAEWNARMARDTTGTVATAYGQAFMASGDGPFAQAGQASRPCCAPARKRAVVKRIPRCAAAAHA